MLRQLYSTYTKIIEKIFKSNAQYIANGSFWLTINQIVVAASGFILSVAYANLIDPHDYGIYKYILSIVSILALTSLPGINASFSQSVAKGYEGDYINLTKKKIKFALLGSISAVCIATYYLLKGNNEFGFAFYLIALFIPFYDTIDLYGFYFQGKKRFDISVIFTSIGQLSITAITIAILFTRPNLFVLLATFFGLLLIFRSIATFITLKKFTPNSKTEPTTFKYGIHLTLINIIPITSQYIDKIVAFQFLGPVGLATYNFAVALPDQIKSYFKNIQTIALPLLTTSDSSTIRKAIIKKLLLLLGIIVCITVVYIIAAPFIYTIFFPKYVSSIFYSQLYAISLISVAAVLPTLALQAKTKKESLYSFNIYRALFQIGAVSAGVYWFGLVGLIGAKICTDLFSLTLSIIYIRHLK